MIPERETLPEDFLDWDGLSDKDAPPLPAISLKGYQSREQIKVNYETWESGYDRHILKNFLVVLQTDGQKSVHHNQLLYDFTRSVQIFKICKIILHLLRIFRPIEFVFYLY